MSQSRISAECPVSNVGAKVLCIYTLHSTIHQHMYKYIEALHIHIH